MTLVEVRTLTEIRVAELIAKHFGEKEADAYRVHGPTYMEEAIKKHPKKAKMFIDDVTDELAKLYAQEVLLGQLLDKWKDL